MTIEDSDWELASAYHDRELPERDARAFEGRLKHEPTLVATLEEIRSLSSSLAMLHPGANRPMVPGPERRWPVRTGLTAAIAAGLVGLALLMEWPTQTPTPLEVHAGFATMTEARPAAVVPVAVSIAADWPDLESANLTTVAVRDLPDGAAAYYVGQNGCRLSYFRMRKAGALPTQDGIQATAWSTSDGTYHLVVATGMDAGKFEAIGTYLRQIALRMSAPSVVAAVRSAAQAAGPCVG